MNSLVKKHFLKGFSAKKKPLLQKCQNLDKLKMTLNIPSVLGVKFSHITNCFGNNGVLTFKYDPNAKTELKKACVFV